MLIIRAPLRVSFIGGGTDFPSFYRAHEQGGAVFGTSISKFVYVMIEHQPEFEDIRYRVTYRVTDSSQSINEIRHPVVRESLNLRNWSTPLNIATMANLPGRSGLGSSSAFTVALNHGLNFMKDNSLIIGESYLNNLAIFSAHIERDILQEFGGHQDQFHAAFGGMRRYEFRRDGVHVGDPILDSSFLDLLSDTLYLVANTKSRSSTTYSYATEMRIRDGGMEEELAALSKLAKEVSRQLADKDISAESKYALLAEGMRQGWELKLSTGVEVNPSVLQQIQIGKEAGANAWKLCGAGGTGFVAFLVEEKNQRKFEKGFDSHLFLKPLISKKGVEIYEF